MFQIDHHQLLILNNKTNYQPLISSILKEDLTLDMSQQIGALDIPGMVSYIL